MLLNKMIKLAITHKEAVQLKDTLGTSFPSFRKKLTEAMMSRAERAKQNGKTLGRPKARTVTKRQIQTAFENGLKWKDCQDTLGISSTTAYRILKER